MPRPAKKNLPLASDSASQPKPTEIIPSPSVLGVAWNERKKEIPPWEKRYTERLDCIKWNGDVDWLQRGELKPIMDMRSNVKDQFLKKSSV